MKMKAVTIDAVGGPVRVEEVDLAEPQGDEVLVRMGASGVCHSDQKVVTGEHPGDFPTILGHEGAGEVVAVGPDVTAVQLGDRVALNWSPSCKDCFYCDRGQHQLCEVVTDEVWQGHMPDGTSRITREGRELLHFSGITTWAEYSVVREVCCTPIPDAVPFDVAALIGCAVSTGVGAVMHRSDVGPGDTVAVVGAGGVGLSVIMGAALAGASQIIAIDREPSKADLAASFGATDFVAADDRAVDRVIELTDGRGADAVFEAIGNNRVQEMWLDGVRRGGELVLVGIPSTANTTPFNTAEMSRDEKTIKGSYYAATDAGTSIETLCAAYVDGKLPVDQLITKRVRIDDVQEAIDAMLTGTEGRSVIVF